jgi:hypothetical protein
MEGTELIGVARHKKMASRLNFKYCLDPVFLTVFVLYFVNRWVIKPIVFGHVTFFHSYFNDLICIPFWLTPLLWVYRRLGIRWHDGPPTRFELVAHLVVWSVFFELIAPRMTGLFPKTVGDPWDVVAYWVGGGIASILWGTWSLHAKIPRLRDKEAIR